MFPKPWAGIRGGRDLLRQMPFGRVCLGPRAASQPTLATPQPTVEGLGSRVQGSGFGV